MAPTRPRGPARGDSGAARFRHAPSPGLSPHLTRDLVGFRASGGPHPIAVLPSPSVTVMLQLASPFRSTPRAFVAGMSLAPSSATPTGVIECLDLKLTPVGAFALLGHPLSELTDRVVDLAELLEERACERLLDGLAALERWDDRLALVDRFLTELVGAACAPDPRIAWCWAQLCRTRGRVPVAQLAEATGMSHRHLIGRFRQQVGLTPKQAARLVRFDRTAATLRQSGATLARLAVDHGFYDQAHMTREVTAMSAMSPRELATATTV